MKDLLKKALLYDKTPISLEQFSEWKRHPVTEALFTELLAAQISQYDDGLIEDMTHSLPVAFKREGARELLDTIFTWEPENVLAIKEGDAVDED